MAAEHCGLAQDMMGYVGLLWSLLPVTWGPGKIPKGTTPVTFFLQLGQPPKVFRTSQNSATCWESSEQPGACKDIFSSKHSRTHWWVCGKKGRGPLPGFAYMMQDILDLGLPLNSLNS